MSNSCVDAASSASARKHESLRSPVKSSAAQTHTHKHTLVVCYILSHVHITLLPLLTTMDPGDDYFCSALRGTSPLRVSRMVRDESDWG